MHLPDKKQRRTSALPQITRRQAIIAGGAAAITATLGYLGCKDHGKDQEERSPGGGGDVLLEKPEEYIDRAPEEQRKYYLRLYKEFVKRVDMVFERLTIIDQEVKREKINTLDIKHPIQSVETLNTLNSGVEILFSPRFRTYNPEHPENLKCSLAFKTEPENPWQLREVNDAFYLYACMCVMQNRMTGDACQKPMTHEEIELLFGKEEAEKLSGSPIRLPEFPTGEQLGQFILERFESFKSSVDKNKMVLSPDDKEHVKNVVNEMFIAGCAYCKVDPHFADKDKDGEPTMSGEIKQQIACDRHGWGMTFAHAYPAEIDAFMKLTHPIPYTITIIDPKEKNIAPGMARN